MWNKKKKKLIGTVKEQEGHKCYFDFTLPNLSISGKGPIWLCIRQTDTVLGEPFKDEAQTALFKDPVRTAE